MAKYNPRVDPLIAARKMVTESLPLLQAVWTMCNTAPIRIQVGHLCCSLEPPQMAVSSVWCSCMYAEPRRCLIKSSGSQEEQLNPPCSKGPAVMIPWKYVGAISQMALIDQLSKKNTFRDFCLDLSNGMKVKSLSELEQYFCLFIQKNCQCVGIFLPSAATRDLTPAPQIPKAGIGQITWAWAFAANVLYSQELLHEL